MATQRPTHEPRTGQDAIHGVIGGLIGGLLMAAACMLLFPLMEGRGAWQPINLIASVAQPEWGMLHHFEPTAALVGLLIHLGMSIALGVLYTVTLGRMPGQLFWAILVFVAVWGVAHYLIMPWVSDVITMEFPPYIFAIAHAVYGLGLGGYLMAATRQYTPASLYRATYQR